MVVLGDGQWMFNGVRFGRNTKIPISSLDLTGYGVAAADYQLARSDEVRFARDSLQPGSMTFQVAAVDNFILPSMMSLTDRIAPVTGLEGMDANMEKFAWAWNSKNTRQQFGVADTLFYGKNGTVFQIYGRARKFAYNARSQLAQYRTATAEFQRVDTLCYTDQASQVTVLPTSLGTTSANIVRSGGLADTWLQILIFGPINHPIVQLGSMPPIDINYNLASGKVLEINTYPWTRRVIDSDGFNVSPLMINNSPYLDQIYVPGNATTPVGFSGGSTTGATEMIVFWREAYNTL